MKSKLIGAFLLAFIGLGTMSASARDRNERNHRGNDRQERRHEGYREQKSRYHSHGNYGGAQYHGYGDNGGGYRR